jgi:hypothetical protein
MNTAAPKSVANIMGRRISRRTGAWIGAASALAIFVGALLATAGPRWLSGQQPSGPTSIGTPGTSARASPSGQNESPSLDDMGNRVTAAGMQVTLPRGWTYRLPTFVSWGPGKPIIYFSNQPMHDECTRIGNSETCDRPIDDLVVDGVLIDWWLLGDYWLESPAPLPSGSPYEVGGREAVRFMVDVKSCGLRATEMERVVIRRATMGRDVLTICSRNLTAATRAELEDLLASIQFVDAPSE